MKLWECPIELAPTYWPKAKPAIEKALGRQQMGLIGGAEYNVLSGAWQLWLAYENDTDGWIGCGVCYIANDSLFVVAWAGALEHIELIPTMVKTMRGRVRALRFIGQDSWGNVLGPVWRRIAVVYELDISDPRALDETLNKERAIAVSKLTQAAKKPWCIMSPCECRSEKDCPIDNPQYPI